MVQAEEEENEPFLNTPEHSYLLNQVCPQGKLDNQKKPTRILLRA